MTEEISSEYINMTRKDDAIHHRCEEYDLMSIFIAKSLRDAKKSSTMILEKYPSIVTKLTFIHRMFSTKNQSVKNPNPDVLLKILYKPCY